MIAGTLFAVAVVQAGAVYGGGPLSYVDSSTGLQTPTMEGGDTELEFGDVNADGHVDLVCIGDHGSPFVNSGQHGIMVWFGDGTGQWSVVQVGDFGYGGLALGDVNNDGLMDVGYAMHHNYSGTDLGDQLIEVALGDGSGTNWTPWDDGLAVNGETWGMFGTDFADLDNDGDLDLGSLSFGCCAGVHIYLNQSDGTWTQSFGVLGGNASSNQFAFGDVNGDGLADFAAAHDAGTVYLGDGQGGFTLADGNLPGSSWRRGISLGDVNGDGRDDLAYRTTTGVQVWSWVGPGEWQDLSGMLAGIGEFSLTQIADMNLDGHGDVVAFKPDLIEIYSGDGSGAWQPAAAIFTPDACDDAALRAGSDVDHNGYPDVALVSEEDCGIFVGGTNRPRLYVESSSPAEPWIHPQSPRGGELWWAGSVRFVDWHAAVPSSANQPSMSIELSLSGPGGPWMTVAAGVPDAGRYQWLLPQDLTTSDLCHLRLTLDTDPPAVVVTPQPFSILGAAVLGDLNGDGTVNAADLALLLGAWGFCLACPEDLDQNGRVDAQDLALLLGNWG